jgi:hypothetical protein
MTSFWWRLARLNGPFFAKRFRELAEELEALFPGEPKWATPIIFQHEGEYSMASIEVADTSGPLTGTVTFLDAEGNPTTADDVPQWTSDNEAAATVVAADDGLSATVTIGAPGAAIIAVHSVNTDGSTVDAQGTVTVLPGDAAVGSVDFAPSA